MNIQRRKKIALSVAKSEELMEVWERLGADLVEGQGWDLFRREFINLAEAESVALAQSDARSTIFMCGAI